MIVSIDSIDFGGKDTLAAEIKRRAPSFILTAHSHPEQLLENLPVQLRDHEKVVNYIRYSEMIVSVLKSCDKLAFEYPDLIHHLWEGIAALYKEVVKMLDQKGFDVICIRSWITRASNYKQCVKDVKKVELSEALIKRSWYPSDIHVAISMTLEQLERRSMVRKKPEEEIIMKAYEFDHKFLMETNEHYLNYILEFDEKNRVLVDCRMPVIHAAQQVLYAVERLKKDKDYLGTKSF